MSHFHSAPLPPCSVSCQGSRDCMLLSEFSVGAEQPDRAIYFYFQGYTNQLNKYLLAELFWKDSFPEKDIHLRLMQCWNGKQFYGTYKKGEMGKDLDNELELDLDAAVAARPNFKIFYENLRDHPSLGPSIVEDSAWLASTLSVDDNYRGETCCISDGACR